MAADRETRADWRGGTYLCTAKDSFQADLLESKLKGEGIPCIRRYAGAGNYVEIFAGVNTVTAIDLYVPPDSLEDARRIIVPIDLDDCEPVPMPDESSNS